MRLIACLLVSFTLLSVQADILHLRGCLRHRGTPVRPAESEIILRTTLADRAGALHTFSATQMKPLERTGHARPSSSVIPGDEPPGDAPGEDFEQMLREAFELVDDDDLPAALRALRRVVDRAPDDVLERLDKQTRAARGVALDDFLAATRIRAALTGRRGRLFALKFATRFEAGALGRQLETLERRLLGTAYHGRTIEAWAAHREQYVELQPDARRMVTEARLAAGVIGARLRFDRRLKQDRQERRRLAVMRDDLARFTARVSALPGFTSLGDGMSDEDDPTLQAARRLAAEQAAASQPAEE